MKCGYNMCENLGVCTDDRIKVGRTYYCKKCYEEKQAKLEIRNKIKEMLPLETMMTINSVIKDLVHARKIDCEYILYVLNDIQVTKKKLNYARGIIYYLNNAKLLEDFKKINTQKQYREIAKETIIDMDFSIPIFNNISNDTSSFTDLL